MKKIQFILLLILLLSGCGAFKSKVSSYPEGILFPIEMDGEVLYDGEIIERIQKNENRLYFSTRKGFIYGLNATDYNIEWRLRMVEAPKSPVFMGQNHFFIFDGKNNVFCFDLDGNPLWQTGLKEEISSPLVEIGNSVLLGTAQGSFLALDRLSGRPLWRFTAPDAIRTAPVFFEGQIIFGCENNNFYFLDLDGNLIRNYQAENKILDALLVDGKFLYYGTENQLFVCLDLKRMFKKWEVKLGGRILSDPISDKKRVFFLAWNNVLYCLHKRNGSILWWKSIPSRSLFEMELYKDKIVVSSMSSLLVCFNAETGTRVGDFDVVKEMRSSPLWNSPLLLVNVYDRQTEKGTLLRMKKVVEMTLSSSVDSPQFINQEIALSVTTVGFHLPKFEFYIKSGEEKNIVQAESEKSTWSWFPSEPGAYIVGATATDEKVSKEAEIQFLIEKPKPVVLLSPSKPSPQTDRDDIIFSAEATGFADPSYEMQINPVRLIQIGKRSVLSFVREDTRDIGFEKTDFNAWTWTPHLGLYLVNSSVSDESELVHVSRYYLVLPYEDLKKLGVIKTAILTPSKLSPYEVGKKILLTADSTAFDNPSYEMQISPVKLLKIGKRSVLSIIKKGPEDFVLNKSGSNNWIWTPTSRGLYKISLTASQESESVNLSKYFSILTEEELKGIGKYREATITPSLTSPQREGETIVFTATSAGFTEPAYNLQVSRINLVKIGKRSLLFFLVKDTEDPVIEQSEFNVWSWTTTNPGLYLINLTVSEGPESLSVFKYFFVSGGEQGEGINKSKKEKTP